MPWSRDLCPTAPVIMDDGTITTYSPYIAAEDSAKTPKSVGRPLGAVASGVRCARRSEVSCPCHQQSSLAAGETMATSYTRRPERRWHQPASTPSKAQEFAKITYDPTIIRGDHENVP